MIGDIIKFQYTNYRGETGERNVIPIDILFIETDYHKGTQWILTAYDMDKDGMPIRQFAMKDIHGID